MDSDISTGGTTSDTDSPMSVAGMDSDAERQAEYQEHCRIVSRDLVFRHLEDLHLGRGETRRRVSGLCGRLMRDLATQNLANIRARIEPGLTRARKWQLQRQLDYLQIVRNRDMLHNDAVFIGSMGGWDDPSRSRLEQQFCLLFHADCSDAELTAYETRLLQEVIS